MKWLFLLYGDVELTSSYANLTTVQRCWMFDFHFHKLLVARGLFIEIILMKFLYNIRPFDNTPSIFVTSTSVNICILLG